MDSYLLYRTRNGQQQWEGPFASRRAAEGRQRQLLAPVSFIVTGRKLAEEEEPCPHASVTHSTEWCGCTCPGEGVVLGKGVISGKSYPAPTYGQRQPMGDDGLTGYEKRELGYS